MIKLFSCHCLNSQKFKIIMGLGFQGKTLGILIVIKLFSLVCVCNLLYLDIPWSIYDQTSSSDCTDSI